MELHQALKHIIRSEGQGIVTDLRLINILNDLNAYQDIQGSKYILRAIIDDGFASRFYQIGSLNNQANDLIHRFTTTTGFNEDNVLKIFQSLAFGLGWIMSMPTHKPRSLNTTPTPVRNPNSKYKPWQKLSVDERETILNSLVEIRESKCGLKYDSVYLADDSDDQNQVCFNINYEVTGLLPKDKWVNLAYAIYDKSNRLRRKSILTSTLGSSKGKNYNIIDSDYVSLNFKYFDIGKILIYIED